VGFEPTIPDFERAKTVHASDRSATVIGDLLFTCTKIGTDMWNYFLTRQDCSYSEGILKKNERFGDLATFPGHREDRHLQGITTYSHIPSGIRDHNRLDRRTHVITSHMRDQELS
jgi:hypothetical protein